VSHRFALDSLPAAFDALDQGEAGMVKAIIEV
jgi:hypothetical protein